MKTSLTAIQLLTVLWVTTFLCGCYGYRTVILMRNVPAGSFIQASDLLERRGRSWTLLPEDFVTDPSQIVGHKALTPLQAGSDVHLADLSSFAGAAK